MPFWSRGISRPVGRLASPDWAERLVLWREASGKIVCMEDRCAHRGTALSLGRVVDTRIACAYHGFQYDASGQCVRIPCAGEGARISAALKVRTFPAREMHGFIFVWWGEERESYPQPPWIEGFTTDPRHCRTRSEIWPFNYTRLIENNLDAHHWAFLHGSIMLGVGERMDEFQMEVDDDQIRAWGVLRRSTMESPSRAEATWEAPSQGPGWWFRLAFRMPNVNMIQVTPRFRSMVFTTPVDEYTSWVAVRVNQTYTRLPLFRDMINLYCIKFLYAIAQYRQDFPIFHSQRPRHTGIGVNRLVEADKAIAAYLQLRERAIKEAARQTADEDEPQPTSSQATTRRSADGRRDGTWNWHSHGTRNGHVPGDHRLPHTENLSQPFPCMLPEPMRNVHIGVEPTWEKALIWMKNFASFPLLLPSMTYVKLVDAKDRLSRRNAQASSEPRD